MAQTTPTNWASHGTARVRAGAAEVDYVWVPHRWRYNQAKRVVIWGHGATGTYAVGPIERALMLALDTVWICATLGGGTGSLTRFGDDASCADVVSAFTYAKAAFNVKADKYVFWGGSMGGQTGPQAAFYDSAKCAAVGGAVPAIDPEYARANNVLGFGAAIATALGNPVAAGKQTYNRGAAWEALGIPMKHWYATDDPFTPVASYDTFYEAAPSVQKVSLGAVGHNYLSIDAQQVIDFLGAYV